MKSDFERAGDRHLFIMVGFVLGLGVLILLFLMLIAPVRAHNLTYDCDPRYNSAEEFFCLRNPASCDPVPFWQCKSIRCARYLLQLDRKQRCPRGSRGAVKES